MTFIKQILCFGDSNTYGLIPGTKDRYDWDTRWTGILAEYIEKEGYRVAEEGLCGRTTVFEDPVRKNRRGTDSISFILETHSPIDTVVLMLGTNDCKKAYNASAEEIGKGIEEILDKIYDFDRNINVLLVSPIELGNKIWEEGYDLEFDQKSLATSKKLPKVYEKIAIRRNIGFIQASKYAKPSKADREHLDENGHKALGNAIISKLESMLIEKIAV